MKKLFLMLAVLILLSTYVNAQQKDVAYVVRTTANQDFVDVLNDLALSFDVVMESDVVNTNFSNYRMMLVGDNFFNNPDLIPVNNLNSFVVNTFHLEDWGLISSSIKLGVTAANQPLNIRNIDINQFVTNGLSRVLQVYTQGNIPLYSLSRAESISRYIVSVEYKADNSPTADHVIAVNMPGTRLSNNKGISQGRITFFGITKSNFWTSGAEELFKRSLLFTLRGYDSDMDGFGNILTGGQDCNDNDSTIYPGAIEIPYDGIDQNCDNLDLVDVDNDGFNMTYDCNDNDPGINPNAMEILDNINQNCRNDAPVLISSIPDQIINEDSINTGLINLSNYFIDTDGDQLIFIVTGNSNVIVEVINNQVDVMPDNNFVGQENIIISASDNIDSSSSNEFLLTVLNVNDLPVLKADILDLIWDEDESISLNLSNYFEDPDNDELIFTFRNNLFINTQISNSQLLLSSPENWHGSDSLIISASDSLLAKDSNNINIIVNSINDNPVIRSIKKIDIETNLAAETFYENKSYLFMADAADIEDKVLIYEWYLNDNLIGLQNEFVYAFDFNSQGNKILNLVVKDQVSETSLEDQIFVNNVNRQPYFEMLDEISVNEDENKLVDILAVDPDNDNLIFNAASSENILCRITQNKLEIIPKSNFAGKETCILTVSDNLDTIEISILIDVLEINDGPLILNTSPSGSQRILQDTEIKFNVEFEDIDSQEIFYNWYFNNNLESTEKELTYLFSQPGINEIKLILNDNWGETEEHTWIINVIENVDGSNFDGETTDFFKTDLNNIQNLILEKTQFGKILFMETVSFGQNKDINNNVIIKENVVAVNSNLLPELNKKARITLKHQEYITEPKIFGSSHFTNDISLINDICEECKIISFSQEPTNDGTVIFEVAGFSSYAVKSINSNEDFEGLCENGEKGDISLRLVEPHDKVNVAEGLKVELKTNDDNLVAKIILVDEDGEEILEKTEDIDDEESEFTFDLEDIDEGDYTLFVKVYEEDNEENKCKEKSKQIEIERPDHGVKVNSFLIVPNVLECSRNTIATVSLENLGKKSEKVSLNLWNNELGINLNQKIILDKYSKKDSKEKAFFNFNLPDNLEKGSYEFTLSLDYEDREELTKLVKANKCSTIKQNNLVVENEVETISQDIKKQENNSVFLVINIISLLIMIYMLVILL